MNTNNLPSIWNSGFAPLGELRQEMDRLFDEIWSTPAARTWRNSDAQWSPACDIEEAEDHYLLTLDMPGIPKDNIKIEVIDNQLMISGERKQEQRKKTDGAWYSERRQGKFQRAFTLPAGLNADKVEANYQDGTLKVYVPKAEIIKPKQIKISSGPTTNFLSKLMGHSSANESQEKAAS